ncbi:hypothetical protein [Dermacoccus nishinomiyaensis]|uniref:hypothetical protein n=1 Tax=Dermacoccus nishinomiyaensis TaxID=1274 RepID=UPI00248E72DE|nr:hypothetical protein [Dermacoccus nishinomiyaensis]
MKQKKLGGGNYSWMYNSRGIRDGITVPLDVAKFDKATHYPDGYFPCGLPVKLNGLNGAEPWKDEAGAKLGFVGGDFDIEEAARGVHVITHPETVKTNRLPVTFTAPTVASVAHINFVEA